jgi:hypothetical protein
MNAITLPMTVDGIKVIIPNNELSFPRGNIQNAIMNNVAINQ